MHNVCLLSLCWLLLTVTGRVPPARDPCIDYITELFQSDTLSLSPSGSADLSKSRTLSYTEGVSLTPTLTATIQRYPSSTNTSTIRVHQSGSKTRTHVSRMVSSSASLSLSNDISASGRSVSSTPFRTNEQSESRSASDETTLSRTIKNLPARRSRTNSASPTEAQSRTMTFHFMTPTYYTPPPRPSRTATSTNPCVTFSWSPTEFASSSQSITELVSQSQTDASTSTVTTTYVDSASQTLSSTVTVEETTTRTLTTSVSVPTLSTSYTLEEVMVLLPLGDLVPAVELAGPANQTLALPLIVQLQGTSFNLAYINVTNHSVLAAPPIRHLNISNGVTCYTVENAPPGASPYARTVVSFFQQNLIFLVTTAVMGELWIPLSETVFLDGDEDVTVKVRLHALCLKRADLTNLTFSFTVTALYAIRTSLTSTEDYVTGGTLIAASLFGGAPGLGYLASRSYMPLNVNRCEVPRSGPLPLFMSPIPWGVGDWIPPPPLDGTVFLTGALLMNVILVIAVSLVQIALAFAYYVVSDTSMLRGFALFRFPSIAAVPLAALLHQTTSVAVMFIAIGARHVVKKWDDEANVGEMGNTYFFSHAPVTMWMGVGVVVVAIMVPIVFMAAVRSCASTRIESRRHPTSALVAFFIGTGKWVDTKGTEILRCTTRYFLVIALYRNDCRSWFAVELILCVLLGGLDGVRLGSGECNPIVVSVALGLTALYVVALIWRRPCSAILGNVLMILIGLAQCVAYAALIAYKETDVLDGETRKLLALIVLWSCRGSLYGSLFKALMDMLAILYTAFFLTWNPDDEADETKDNQPMLEVPDQAEADRSAMVQLAYAVHDEVAAEPTLQKDEHLVERYVAALLQLTTPGLEAEGQRRLLSLVEEIDAMSLANRQVRLTPQMELLHKKLSAAVRQAPSHGEGQSMPRSALAPVNREDGNSSNGSFRIDFSPTSSSRGPPTEADRQRHINEMLGDDDPMFVHRSSYLI